MLSGCWVADEGSARWPGGGSILLFLDFTFTCPTFLFFNILNYIYGYAAAAAAKSLQSCPTLCDPIDGSPPGLLVPGILQARTLEWVAISFSNARKWKLKVKSLRRVWLFATPWTAAHQAPPPMGFSRQEYWSGVPSPFSSVQFTSVQSLSCVWLFAAPWITARQASLSITNSWSSLKLTTIESVMPSSHLILLSPFPPAPNPSQHQSLSQWVNSSHEVAKVLEFQL